MLAFEQPPDDVGVLSASIVELWHRLPGRKADGKLIEIPVVYGSEQGFDLPAVAARAGLSEREVIRIHSDGEYTVCAVASSPGFGYLHGLDPRIYMPRKSVPSLNMSAARDHRRDADRRRGLDQSERMECDRLGLCCDVRSRADPAVSHAAG